MRITPFDMTNAFSNQAVLVTGGSTGIGAAAALAMANAGAKVLITGRHEATLKESAGKHPSIVYLVADVAKPADAARTIGEVKQRLGRLDVLVNNAGVAEIAPLADASIDHVRRQFDVNVIGLIEMTRLALPLLRESKGTIVNIASIVADEPFAKMSAYCATKAAVVALTRSWAQELAADGVRVNVVSPGPIETPIFMPEKLGVSQAQLDQFGADVLARVPLGRFGKPEEVASVIAFVASRAASYVTGAQFSVGGGIDA
jgi:NAD(P)-dependent dehydrogenase (short-subunit alcohol dehydrogenase family)